MLGEPISGVRGATFGPYGCRRSLSLGEELRSGARRLERRVGEGFGYIVTYLFHLLALLSFAQLLVCLCVGGIQISTCWGEALGYRIQIRILI